MKINYRQLTFAREYRGYSQSELASNITGLSQPNLSKYEKGFNTLSDDMVEKIIEYLNFPKDWLYLNISNLPENANYRKKATITKKEKSKIEYGNRLIGYIVDQMSDSITWPEFNHAPLDIEEGHTPESIAKYARKTLGILPPDPVADINTLLENKGIVIVEIEAHEKFDGVSFLTDKGNPLIIINKNFSNDRKRRTLAHEYGHILMHCYFPIPKHRGEKEREDEADEFANEFLMPSDYIRNSLIGLRLGNLVELKTYWLTSIQSIIRRAKDLNCITKDRYTYFNIELSRLGIRKDEGINVYIDEPSLFKTAYNLHIDEIGFSDKDLSQAFTLPDDIILGTFKPNNLRVIHKIKMNA
ncbi:XRE family transcriptional regulator [Flavobacterium hydrophilum]|uniref:DNA-binding protein n=1 Tax=Flavobacterium hydrophilum TaxID=2211445 RepID=A0A2V4CL55_9FLAO|nr:XRE family transcriptional regulator [Flavobacterium hydrophilum]PXY46494.1 DNA-binding protein [Flavobacterium hydrophilum]